MSTWYPSFLQALLERPANSDLSGGTVKFAFLTSAYTYSAAHDFRDDLTGVIGTPVTLGSKVFTDGQFAATVPDYSGSDLNGQTATQGVVFIDTGTPSTSRLVMHLDDAAVLPITGSGSAQPISWTTQPVCTTTGGGNIWFPKFAEALFTRPANSDLVAGTVKAVLIDTGAYTYNAAHDFLDDVPSGARIGTPQTIGSKTFTNGVFDGADISFPALTGTSCENLLVYIDTGVESTSRTVVLVRSAQGLPLTPIGVAQPVAWHATDGVAKLGATA